MSFRYYDFIITLVQDKVSFEKREFFKSKKQVAMIFDRNKNRRGLFNQTTQSGTKAKKQKVTVKNEIVNVEIGLFKSEIDHLKSAHTMMK